jgi:DNA polymerase III gamma/tau subunit
MDRIQKYIPDSIYNFCGNENIINTLQFLLIQKKHIPNIIFSGEYGYGKTTIMNLFIQELDIKHILKVDLNEDLKKNNKHNKSDNKIINFLKKKEMKIIIIDNCSTLTIEQQYILKSFVKYYKNTLFFLCLQNTSNLISQLGDYFMILTLKPFLKKESTKYISNIFKQEDIIIDNKIINYIIEISFNIRDINNNISILLAYKDVLLNENKILTYKNIDQILNISDKKYTLMLIKYCCNKNINGSITLLKNLMNKGYSIIDIINLLTIHIKNINIDHDIKMKFIKLISMAQIRIISNNLNTYTQLLSLISKMCQV